MGSVKGSPVNLLIYALVGVLAICAALVVAASAFRIASTELVVSVLGLAGVVVATLVGLLNAQLASLHTTVNSRMDELIQSTRDAAFARGQSTTGLDPAVHGPSPLEASQSQPPSSSG